MEQSSSSGSAVDLILQWVCNLLVTLPCLNALLSSPLQRHIQLMVLGSEGEFFSLKSRTSSLLCASARVRQGHTDCLVCAFTVRCHLF